MSVNVNEIAAGVQQGLDQYAQYTSGADAQPETQEAGKKILNVNVESGSITATVDLDPADDGVLIYGSDDGGTTTRVIKTDATGAIQVDIESAIPAGTNIVGRVGIDQTTPGTTNGVVVNNGNVGGFTTLVQSTITMSVAGAYATGDYMGT